MSCGIGDIIGDISLTPACFGWMTCQLMQLCRVVLGLEGGYVPSLITEGCDRCLRALLGEVSAAEFESQLQAPSWPAE